MKKDRKRWLKLMCAGGIVLVSTLLPGMGGLTQTGVRAAGILTASLLMWITDAMPMSISILLMIGASLLTGLTSPETVIGRADGGTALFVLASSGVTAAMALSGIPRRMTQWLLRGSRGSTARFVTGFALLVALCSSIMSSLATCALFAGLVSGMLGQKRTPLKRCLMLLVPACAGIGGFMTPAGTPANLLLLQLLEDAGTPVTFLQWCLIGIPAGIITTLLFAISTLLLLRPRMTALDESLLLPGKTDARRDSHTAVILLLMLCGWIASGWVPALKLWHVACAGVAMMLLPKVGIMNLRALSQRINWDLVITMGTVGILMGAVADSGLMAWLSDQLLRPLAKLPDWLLLPCISLAVCCIRAFIPTTTGAVTLLAPVLTGLAAATGQPSCVLLMLLAFWTASAMLVVYTEPIYLITWAGRDYSAGDLLRTGAVPSLLMALPGSFLLQALTLAALGL